MDRVTALKDYQALVKAKPELRIGKLVGCRAVDYGTYSERLKASRRGRKSPYEMLNNPADRAYLEGKAKQLSQKLHSILGLYAGLVPSFRPLHAKYLCYRFNASCLLDPCGGWGGRMLGAVSLGCKYICCETNVELMDGYQRLTELTGGDIRVIWQPAETVDFTELDYDFIMSSPPFDDLEIYRGCPRYTNWLHQMLLPTTTMAFASLKTGGWMALCIPEQLAAGISDRIGRYDETITLPIRNRTNGKHAKHEVVYCWHKK